MENKMNPLIPYIEPLSEQGCSVPFGYWIKGHIDPTDFLKALVGMGIIPKGPIKVGYYRVIKDRVYFFKDGGRGASRCTWMEI